MSGVGTVIQDFTISPYIAISPSNREATSHITVLIVVEVDSSKVGTQMASEGISLGRCDGWQSIASNWNIRARGNCSLMAVMALSRIPPGLCSSPISCLLTGASPLYSFPSTIPRMAKGSLKSSYGAKAACVAGGSDVERLRSRVPSGKASGEKRLRSGRASGVISPSLTADSSCKRATKDSNRDRLIRPTGSRRTRTRAGATGERGSPPMGTFGRS